MKTKYIYCVMTKKIVITDSYISWLKGLACSLRTTTYTVHTYLTL